MARYYFHIADDKRFTRDEEGMEFPSLDAALREAQASARDLLIQELKDNQAIDHRRVEVWDEDGRRIEVFPLRDLVH